MLSKIFRRRRRPHERALLHNQSGDPQHARRAIAGIVSAAAGAIQLPSRAASMIAPSRRAYSQVRRALMLSARNAPSRICPPATMISARWELMPGSPRRPLASSPAMRSLKRSSSLSVISTLTGCAPCSSVATRAAAQAQRFANCQDCPGSPRGLLPSLGAQFARRSFERGAYLFAQGA